MLRKSIVERPPGGWARYVAPGAAVLLCLTTAACTDRRVSRGPVHALPMVVGDPGAGGHPRFVPVPPEENPAIVPAASAEGLPAGGPYRFEVEDLLAISVYGEEDLQAVEVPVRPDGMISFTFIGDVMAAGRTVEEIRKEMTDRLGQYLRSPQVTVIAKQFAQKKVFVGGEVKNPGVLYLGGREGTLLDALYKVGLATAKADLDGAYLIRANKVVAADFGELIRGDVTRNVRLMDQDIVYIPESNQRYIYVLGETRRNDALEVTQPVPIIQALARAGGLTDFSKKREIAVIRGGLKNPQIAVIDAKALLEGDFSQNILVQPGDIIFVAKSALGKWNLVIDTILRTISPIVQGVIVREQVTPDTR